MTYSNINSILHIIELFLNNTNTLIPMYQFLFRYSNRKYHFVNLRNVFEFKETHFYEIIYEKMYIYIPIGTINT